MVVAPLSNPQSLFRDVLALDDVKGLLFLAETGQVLYSKAQDKHLSRLEQEDWNAISKTLARVREVDFFYGDDRIYLRRTAHGYLLVWMGGMAPVDMVKLNCEVVIASLP